MTNAVQLSEKKLNLLKQPIHYVITSSVGKLECVIVWLKSLLGSKSLPLINIGWLTPGITPHHYYFVSRSGISALKMGST